MHTFTFRLKPGCKIYTTPEIVNVTLPGVVYKRKLCDISGYEELVIYPNAS